MLLFGAWGGLLADRFPKRSLLIVTQTLMALPALALWALTATGVVTPWMVFALVFVRGAVNSVDNPTRQSFVIEMVGAERVVNAVEPQQRPDPLGPHRRARLRRGADRDPRGRALLPDATPLTFVAMIVALRAMEPDAARARAARRAGRGAVRAALRYVVGDPGACGPAGDDGRGRHPGLQLPGHPAAPWPASASTGARRPTRRWRWRWGSARVVGALVAGARGRVGPRLLVAAAVRLRCRRR